MVLHRTITTATTVTITAAMPPEPTEDRVSSKSIDKVDLEEEKWRHGQRHDGDDSGKQYPSSTKLAFILLALSLAVFLYGLDQTIIATAIPKITDQFHALNDVGWYAAAYLLTSSACQLLWGRLFTVFSVKAVYLAAVGLFELGSLICAVAPGSTAFIVGRAFAGVGAAGVYSGSVIVLTHCAPLARRPLYTGILGAAVGIASVVGPFLGGVLADDVTWRWCFYINLPIGAVAAAVVALTVSAPPDPRFAALGWTERLLQLDFPGVLTLTPAIVCLLLALQWGGLEYRWDNARIVVLFVLAGVLGIAFLFIQRYMPRTRTIPPSVFGSRSMPFTIWYAGCTFALFMIMTYYLPVYFQGVQRVSALESGVRTMPLIIGFIIFALLSGAVTSGLGYYTPLMIASSIIKTVGLGLLTTLTPDSPSSHWIGYQALFGIGLGTGIQQPLIVIQTVLSEADVPVGTALLTLVQALFGAIFVAVAQTIFQNRLRANVGKAFPGIDISLLLTQSGVSSGPASLPPMARDNIPLFLETYSKSITQTFYLPVALGALSIIGALGTEWKSVKKEKDVESERESGATHDSESHAIEDGAKGLATATNER